MFPKGMAQGFFSLATHGRQQNVWVQIGGFKSLEDEALNRFTCSKILWCATENGHAINGLSG